MSIPYQYALRRRMMQTIERNVELSISGSFYGSDSYVSVDGVNYKKNTTLSLPKGTEVSIKLYGSNAKFTLNDNSVDYASSSDYVHTYTFVLTADAAIVVSNSSAWNPTATITMPA